MTNKAIARKMTEAFNKLDLAMIDEVLSQKFVSHIAESGRTLTREEYIAGVKGGAESFEGLHSTIDDMVAEGDKVAIRFTNRGKHTKEFMGLAPTGKKIEFKGMTIRRIENGKVAEEWLCNDVFTLFRQLGFTPKL
jgi:steroid delta-isomerase-like uncharacterized protein